MSVTSELLAERWLGTVERVPATGGGRGSLLYHCQITNKIRCKALGTKRNLLLVKMKEQNTTVTNSAAYASYSIRSTQLRNIYISATYQLVVVTKFIIGRRL